MKTDSKAEARHAEAVTDALGCCNLLVNNRALLLTPGMRLLSFHQSLVINPDAHMIKEVAFYHKPTIAPSII